MKFSCPHLAVPPDFNEINKEIGKLSQSVLHLHVAKDILASEGVESISIKKKKKTAKHKTYLDVLDILAKREGKRKVRGEGGEIAANKAFQQTLPRRR